MKKHIGLACTLIFVAAVLAFTPGCKTVVSTGPDGSSVTNQVPNTVAIASAAAAAQSAAFLGTEIYLNGLPPTLPGHPQDRQAFEIARDSLQALIAAGTFSADDLTAALKALPVKSLQGDQGTLLIGEGVTVWDTYGVFLMALDKSQAFNAYVLPVAKGIESGLNQALGVASPASSVASPK